VIASVAAFALMHGPSAFMAPLLALYLVSGAAFALLFLWMKSSRLEILIVAHTALDLVLVAAP
jgi:membrane protease YdiL (CAAX protease family)